MGDIFGGEFCEPAVTLDVWMSEIVLARTGKGGMGIYDSAVNRTSFF